LKRKELTIFTMRCYAEGGYATLSRPSVCSVMFS